MSFNAKNWTDSREAEARLKEGFQTIKQYSNMGITRVMYNVVRVEGGTVLVKLPINEA